MYTVSDLFGQLMYRRILDFHKSRKITRTIAGNCNSINNCLRKEEEIWLRKPLYHQKIEKVKRQHKDATKNFDQLTIADRLRVVSWSNYCHPPGVIKGDSNLPTYRKSCEIKRTHFLKNPPLRRNSQPKRPTFTSKFKARGFKELDTVKH